MPSDVSRTMAVGCLVACVLVAGPAGAAAQEEDAEQQQEQTCELEGSEILDQAEDILNEAAEMDTTDATAAAADAQYEQAWKRVQLALQQDSSSAAAYYMAGRASIGLGAYARADSMLARFVELEPGCASAAEDIRFGGWAESFNRGIRAYQANDDSTALERFERANALRRDPRSLNNAAIIYQQRGETDRAAELYRESLEIAEGNDEYSEQFRAATINLAELLRNRGDREEMLAIYRDYLAQRPGDARAKVNFAVGLREAGQADSAQAVLQSVVDRDDLTFRERLDVGRSLMGMKDYEGARTALLQARRARPYHKDVMQQLMTARANSGDLAGAAALGDTLIRWYPYQKQLLQSLVQVLDKQGSTDRVQQILPDLESMDVRIPRAGLIRRGENTYVVRGQIRGETVTDQTVGLPVSLVGPEGQTVAETTAEVRVPGADELSAFQVTIETDQPVAGFRYGRIERGS